MHLLLGGTGHTTKQSPYSQVSSGKCETLPEKSMSILKIACAATILFLPLDLDQDGQAVSASPCVPALPVLPCVLLCF